MTVADDHLTPHELAIMALIGIMQVGYVGPGQ